MATYETPTPSENGGNNTAIIILAMIIIAALVVAGVLYMNGGTFGTSTVTNTTDRTVTRIEQVPAPATPTTVVVSPPAETAPAETAPAEPATTPPQQ